MKEKQQKGFGVLKTLNSIAQDYILLLDFLPDSVAKEYSEYREWAHKNNKLPTDKQVANFVFAMNLKGKENAKENN